MNLKNIAEALIFFQEIVELLVTGKLITALEKTAQIKKGDKADSASGATTEAGGKTTAAPEKKIRSHIAGFGPQDNILRESIICKLTPARQAVYRKFDSWLQEGEADRIIDWAHFMHYITDLIEANPKQAQQVYENIVDIINNKGNEEALKYIKPLTQEVFLKLLMAYGEKFLGLLKKLAEKYPEIKQKIKQLLKKLEVAEQTLRRGEAWVKIQRQDNFTTRLFRPWRILRLPPPVPAQNPTTTTVSFGALPKRTLALSYNAYEQLHARFLGFILYGAVAPIALSMLFAAVGWGLANQIMVIVSVLACLYFGTKPGVVASSGATGAITNLTNPWAGAKELYAKVFGAVAIYALCLSIWFFFIGTFGISRNWGSVITVLAALALLFAMSHKWLEASPRRALVFIRAYAISILVFSIASTISPVAYNKTIGFDPVPGWRTTAVDNKIVSVEEIGRKAKEEYGLLVLASISNNIKPSPGVLIDINEAIAKEAQVDANLQEINKRKQKEYFLLRQAKRVRELFSNPSDVEGADDNPLISITKYSDKVWEVEFLTDQMTTVLRRWPKGTTIVFSGFKKGEVMRNNPAGGDNQFYLPVGIPLGRTTDTPLIAKYKKGGKILLNFS